MKYELVESLPLSPLLVDVAEHVARSANVPGPGITPREYEDRSYATSLKVHFSQVDPAHLDMDVEEPSENAEPNVTRCFRNTPGFVWNASSPAKPQALITWGDEKNGGTENASDLSNSTKLLSGRNHSQDDLMEQVESTEAPDVLDGIIEVESVSSTPFVDDFDPGRHIRRLVRVANKKLSYNDESVVSRYLRKLADSCAEKTCPHRTMLIETGAVTSIVAAIQRFPSSPVVTSRGLRALQNISCRSPLAREILGRLDGAKIMCRAMRKFSCDVKVQRDGCGALLNFLLNDDCDNSRSKSFVREGGLQVVLTAMDRHHSDSKLSEWACRCVHALCKNSKDHRPTVWNNGGFTAILTARENHPENQGIAKAARSANRMFWNEYEIMFKRRLP